MSFFNIEMYVLNSLNSPLYYFNYKMTHHDGVGPGFQEFKPPLEVCLSEIENKMEKVTSIKV